MGTMRVEQLLAQSAARHGHKTAIVAGRASHTYAELARKSDRLAAALSARGIGRGDRILMFLGAGFPAVVCTFGILKADAVACPVDPASDADTLARLLADLRPSAIVTEARLALRAASAVTGASGVRLVVLVGGGPAPVRANCISFEDAVNASGAHPVATAGRPEDVALMIPPDRRAAPARPYTHAEVVASALAPDGSAVSFVTYQGFCRLVGALAAGMTQILEASRLAPGGHPGGLSAALN